MKKLLTIILTITTLILAAIFNWHGETAKAQEFETFVNCEKSFGGNAPESCEQIVYSVDRENNFNNDLFIINTAGANPVGLLPPEIDGKYPQISKNGRLILFASRAPDSELYNLYVMKSDGTERIQLTDTGLDSPDAKLSPDGGKVVFSRFDNSQPGVFSFHIYTINKDGTGLTQLNSGEGRKENPVFSPDGTKILFIRKFDSGTFAPYELVSINTDGTNETRLTNTPDFQNVYDAAYTPDGSKIVFSTWCGGGCGGTKFVIEIMNADGTARTRLTNPAVSSYAPKLNPNGTKIVFYGDAGTDFLEVYTMNTDGTGILNVSASSEDEFFPFYTADGQSIIFQRNGNMMKMNADGTNVVLLRNDYDTTSKNTAASGLLDADADGVFGECDNCPSAANAYRVAFANVADVWAMNADGTNLMRLTRSVFSGFQMFNDEPSFSADGRKILFTSNRNNNRDEIYIMNADGTNQTRITNRSVGDASDADNSAVFNPSATKIAFKGTRRVAGNTNRNLFVMNADGTNQTQLTFFSGNLNYAGNPHFNHDGTRIAYEALAGNLSNFNADIYAINPDGTNNMRLTTAAGYDTDPAYSPDGSKIVFLSQRNGGGNNNEVYIMNADGTNQTRLTNTTESEFEPTFTPDGTKIAFARNRVDTKLYLMDLDGGNVRRVSSQTGSFYENQPTFAPQADADGDGTGDACDASFDANTPAGANVTVQAPSATVNFSNVSQAGVTSFTPIAPNQNDLPQGYTLCPDCPAYDITTTTAIAPPITVCLGIPSSVTQSLFLQMSLLHGENGVLVDRTTNRITDGNGQRYVCGEVNSLSPFVLASTLAPTAAQVSVSGRALTKTGRGISNVKITLTDAGGGVRIARTNAFGYFHFHEVSAGQTYILRAVSKSYIFAEPVRILNVLDEIADIEFIAAN